MRILLLTLLLSSTIFAKQKDYKFGGHSFKLDVPKKWDVTSTRTFQVIGPATKKRRPVLSVLPSGMKNIKEVEYRDTKKAEEGYRLGRLKWLQKSGAKLLHFLPYKKPQDWNRSVDVNEFGIRYSIKGVGFEEKSYYVFCDKQFFLLKSLIPLDQLEKSKDPVERIASSFRCR